MLLAQRTLEPCLRPLVETASAAFLDTFDDSE